MIHLQSSESPTLSYLAFFDHDKHRAEFRSPDSLSNPKNNGFDYFFFAITLPHSSIGKLQGLTQQICGQKLIFIEKVKKEAKLDVCNHFPLLRLS